MFEIKDMKFHTLRIFAVAALSMSVFSSVQALDKYVAQGGTGKGASWAEAYGRVQDAIKAVAESGGGNVFVKAGTYTPTSTTGENGVVYSAFQIPSGVKVYGGFAGTETGATAEAIIAARATTTSNIGMQMVNKTIFSGNLNGTAAEYVWNDQKHRFSTTYYGSSHHVVVFTPTVGTKPSTSESVSLDAQAILDGVVITGGHANNASIEDDADHTAYGGGVWMIGNSLLQNCEVYNCEASRDGGGIYMMGGLVENCYIHDCQAMGVNTVTGMGGGIAIKDAGSVSHSAILNNASRLGGGMSFSFSGSGSSKTGEAYAKMAVSASLIAQNVASIEAGGIYMNGGGVINGVTVVNNKTFGTGSTLDGKVTGRSGGVYARDYTRIYNSVLWGNKTHASSADGLQFFSSRSKIHNDYKTQLHYVALSRAEYTDWSSSTKYNVFNIEENNTGSSTTDTKFVNFKDTCSVVGHYPSAEMGTYIQTIDWTPKSTSALCYAGVQLKDLSDAPVLAILTTDIVDKEYSPKCDLGAYVAEEQKIASGLRALYVDPAGNISNANKPLGQSWDNPLDNLNDAIAYFKGTLGGTVYVKEGTVYTSSRSSVGSVREQSVEMVSGVSVLGGYSTSLEGTDISLRDYMSHPTIISGYVSDNYDDNAAHLVTFNGVNNAVLDGFQLKWGNATSFTNSAGTAENYGAGICFLGSNTNLSIKNIFIANCTSVQGAAIYANDGGSATFENCIFHNNSSSVSEQGGVVYVQGASELTFNHCDFLRNVGYAIVVEKNSTAASVVINNNIFFANMDAAFDDTKQHIDHALTAITGLARQVTGSYNVFDKATTLVIIEDLNQDTDVLNTLGTVCLGLNDNDEYTYARFANPTKNSGASLGTDNTTYGRATDFTPTDTNPAVNAASTGGVAHTSSSTDSCWGVDMTNKNRDYGGLPDAGAIENGGKETGSATQPAYGTKYFVRDYHSYDNSGNVLAEDFSTTHADGTLRDGLSWANAINGNALYSYTKGGTTHGINGLQYAVYTMHDNLGLKTIPRTVTKTENQKTNTLSYYDLPDGKKDGEVWVAAGIYTKPEGFVISNHVKVLGGFPKKGNPGLSERHPQLSEGIAMSSQNQALNLNFRDYESVLQTNTTSSESLANEVSNGSATTTSVALTADMFKRWSSSGAGATETGTANCEIHFDGTEQTQYYTFYGDYNVNYLNYADLSAYGSMVIKGSGTARLLFNRQTDNGNDYTEKVVALTDAGTTINLADITLSAGFAHLNVIKAPWSNTCSITEVSLISQGSSSVSNEVNDFTMDLDDKVFVVTAMDGESIFYFAHSGSSQDVKLGKFNNLKNSADNYYFMKFIKVTDSSVDKSYGDVYAIQMYNSNGARFAYTSNAEGFLNAQESGNIIFAIGLGSNYGQDGTNLALWRVGYDTGQGFYIQNVARAQANRSSYISPTSANPQSNKVYVRLFAQGASVVTHPAECRPTTFADQNVYQSRTIYEGTEWDGFTLRNGYKFGVVRRGSNGGRRQGGAGACIYENAIIRNCVIKNNTMGGASAIGRGAGMYCDGGSIINCYVTDNVSNCLSNGNENYGGGIYMITGTLYNTVIAHNTIKPTGSCVGAGIYMESASFYNNTIVYNTGASAIGMYTSSTTEAARLTVYNSIVIAAPGQNVLYRASTETPVTFSHCYLQQTTSELQNTDDGTYAIKDCIFGYTNQNQWDSFGPFALKYSEAVSNYDYRITTIGKGPSNDGKNNDCVNAGTENIGTDYLGRAAVLPDNDMDWDDRIQDCRVDIGAYEFNGAAAITPDTDTSRTGDANTVVYYVTELGFGTTQAFDPANAACASKLQKVLDAAGRYKYNHTNTRVIVKLAGIDATRSGYNESTCFKYYPCRTTDEGNDNVRVWSIQVPRGVEVWGGYTVDDVLNLTTNADIAPRFSDNYRSTLYCPTYLQNEYDSKTLNERVKSYHVVSFTDRLFDKDGKPFLKDDTIGDDAKSSFNSEHAYEESDYKHLSDNGVTERAVIDGLILTGGQADGEAITGKANINQLGGAAIVNDFAHVRNCIIKGNTATYGGGLALTKKALVSGSLIKGNEATKGGGIYIIEDEMEMSDGTTNSTKKSTSGAKLDENMPHVYTSTIVANSASSQGGGIWFTDGEPNVRVNSTVLWKNLCSDQANVAGNTKPDLSNSSEYSTFEWYPFAYSAVESQRVSGASNVAVDVINEQGVRFGKDSQTNKTTYGINGAAFTIDAANHTGDVNTEPTISKTMKDVSFYGLTNFSALCRTGMPWSEYTALVSSEGLTHADINNWCRDIVPTNTESRQYIDIGCRSYPSSPLIDTDRPILRLFVAQTEDVDMEAYYKIQKANVSKTDANYIYTLLGSSFAYPFQSIDDALDYITSLRKSAKWQNKANNWPFEICVARGEYHPQRDMQGNYGYSLSNTFLIPEGVTLVGGFDCNDIYGQKWAPVTDRDGTNVLSNNVTKMDGTLATLNGQEIKQLELDSMLLARPMEDINMNNILEPWEFMNSTNLSGNSVNHERGVYHTVSVVPYAPGVGQLPAAVKNNSANETVTDFSLDCGKLTGYAGTWAGTPNTTFDWQYDGAVKVTTTQVQTNNYDVQYKLAENISLTSGNKYTLTVRCKAESTTMEQASVDVQIAAIKEDGSNNTTYYGTDNSLVIPVGQDYRDISVTFTAPTSSVYVMFQHGHFVGSVYWKSITITHEETKETGVAWVDPKDSSFNKEYWAYHSRFEGQPVIIDGVKISEGYAGNYATHSLTDYSIYDYYHGGGLHATGNWYCDDINGVPNKDDVYYSFKTNSVAYRDIPLYIRNCQFVNNTAGYGAALNTNVSTYVYSSYFAQNQAIRKNENVTWEIVEDGIKDKDGKTYTQGQTVTFANNYPGDGGAIYYNKNLEVYNSIFANNEAKDESGIDPYGAFPTLKNQSQTRLTYSGAGGALCGGVRSHLLMLNCDVVRNKALVYPAVFTMNPNGASASTGHKEEDYNQIVNTLFWGNEVTSSDFAYGNDFARPLAVNYGSSDRTETYDAALSKQPMSQTELDSDTYGEAMWFCAYEKNNGKTPVYNNDYRDYKYSQDYYIGDSIPENNNIFLSSDNDAIDGPNLVKPTVKAGYAGHNENADWSRSRVNNLTDNGSGMIVQTDEGFGASDDAKNSGVYYTKYRNQYFATTTYGHINLFNETYMRTITGSETSTMTRIAHDPLEGVKEARIDIGVYERPKVSLRITGGEVDIIWVAAAEVPENGVPNGTSWRQPTADLQRAIETLLSSHNDRRKEIRLLDGEYSPSYIIEKEGKVYQSFYINTQELQESAVLPTGASRDANYSVNSLTIKGGYSKDIPYRDDDPSSYNTDLYRAVFRMPMRQTPDGCRWDRLFYIDDATKRYGRQNDAMTGYGALIANGNGGNIVNAETFYPSQTVTTVPIQFDGITFINNQALPGVEGSAIYYADQTTTFTSNNKTYYYEDNAPESAWVTDENGTGTSKYVNGVGEEVGTYNYSVIDNPAKLILSKCHVLHTGNESDANSSTASAVYIGQYGGDALIYNSVFHSNLGNPIVAYNTRTVNNTIALNKGMWRLLNQTGTVGLNEDGSGTGDGPMLAPAAASVPDPDVSVPASSSLRRSVILNSILWKNNPVDNIFGSQFLLPGYTSDAASGAIFKNNAYTVYNAGVLDVTEAEDINLAPENYNVHLTDQNESLENGPRFEDPENTSVESRLFTLKPSIRIINKGAKSIYNNEVYDLSWVGTTGFDFVKGQRIFSREIEKGAIEYQNSFDHRVYYVKPGESINGSGYSWDHAMNSVSKAVEQAALYCLTNDIKRDEEGNITDPNEAYVFVESGNVNEALTLGSGVNVYGSVADTDTIPYTIGRDGVPEYYNDENTHYSDFKNNIFGITNARSGLVGLHTTPTVIPSVTTPENTAFDVNRPTRVDGFIISKGKEPVTAPVLKITPATKTGVTDIPPVCVSNVVVADNDASASAVNMAEIDNALIYEVLFRDNKTSEGKYVLRLGSRAYGVNLTVEGEGKTFANNVVPATNADNEHMFYSIYNYAASSETAKTLSKYNYELPKANLNYQLSEKSPFIDACPVVNPMAGNATTANLAQFINYDTDRDLLGNPRVLNTASALSANYLDRGAFETWKVGDDNTAIAVATNTYYSDYYGNYYPHEGSVVYLMENSKLITQEHAFVPGFLLVKKGASLYGHQGLINAAYLAVERDIPANGSVIALPYDMKYKSADVNYGPAEVSYSGSGVLTLTSKDNATAQTYNGDSRALSRYQILGQNSGCWNTPLAANVMTAANTGVYFDAKNTETKTFRFTAKGENMADYLYSEAEDLVSKAVTLSPYNNEPTNGFGMLTAKEDMGWNCFGIPYLVSEYKPYLQDDDNDFIDNSVAYQMHLPKTLWLYYGASSSAAGSGYVETEGNKAGFYPAKSWEGTTAAWHLAESETPALWVGEGMFAQTASYSDEDVTFYLPLYTGTLDRVVKLNAPQNAPQFRTYIETIEDNQDLYYEEGIIYDLHGRKVQNPQSGQIYIQNGKKFVM